MNSKYLFSCDKKINFIHVFENLRPLKSLFVIELFKRICSRKEFQTFVKTIPGDHRGQFCSFYFAEENSKFVLTRGRAIMGGIRVEVWFFYVNIAFHLVFRELFWKKSATIFSASGSRTLLGAQFSRTQVKISSMLL